MFIERLVYEAGAIALDYHKSKFDVYEKADGSPVTTADYAVSDYLLEKIRWTYPDDCLASEEALPTGAQLRQAKRVWFIDPIDGTSFFANGMDEFGVLIGLWQGGDIISGAASFPAMDSICSAETGLGTYVNGERVRVSQRTGAHARISCWGSQYRQLNTVDEPMVLPSFAMMQVAAGELDGIILDTEGGWGQHDLAFAVPIIEEAGGVITDGHGFALRFNRAGSSMPKRVVCSNGKTHRSLLGWV